MKYFSEFYIKQKWVFCRKYSFRNMSLQVNQSEQNTNDADGSIKRWLGILDKYNIFWKTAIT